MDIVAASVPLFFALIGLEILVSRRRRSASYRLNDSDRDLWRPVRVPPGFRSTPRISKPAQPPVGQLR